MMESTEQIMEKARPPKSRAGSLETKKSSLSVFPQKFLPTLPSLLATPGIPLIHRDLSWLQFNQRVLEQARPTSQNPPVERVKFLAIGASNLDEFFMIRFSSLGREIQASKNHDEINHLIRTRNAILENVAQFGARQQELLELISAELDRYGIHIVRDPEQSDKIYDIGKRLFEEEVLFKLPPPETLEYESLASLNNLQMAAVFPAGLWFCIPRALPYVLWHQEKSSKEFYFYFLDRLLLTYLKRTFRQSESPGIVRITRDADITTSLIEQGTEPTPNTIRDCLRSYNRGQAGRLQYLGNVSPDFLEKCSKKLGLDSRQVLPAPSTACLSGLWTVVDHTPIKGKQGKELLYPPLKSHLPKPFARPVQLFNKLKSRDFLLHHPYDSFDGFLNWIEAGCRDPQVSSIELTLYRVGTLSPIVTILKEAAQRKKVRIIIELRARFDESNNLQLAEELAKAGVEVGFGFGKLKLHAKIALITRKEDGQNFYYTHLSTGNYNVKTAKQYTDIGIFTANQEVGSDARKFFDAVLEGKIPSGFKQLVLAPTNLHRRLISLIDSEIRAAKAKKPARIVVKVNALVDEAVIAALYHASQQGVQVDLIVRGACSLIPKVAGLSKKIRVVSIIDRFLEHSRFYYFQNANKMYLSSADWMPRNFFRRLEIAFPVLDEKLLTYLSSVVIPTYLSDTVKARELTAQGTWKKRSSSYGKKPTRAQFVFEELAKSQYEESAIE